MSSVKGRFPVGVGCDGATKSLAGSNWNSDGAVRCGAVTASARASASSQLEI